MVGVGGTKTLTFEITGKGEGDLNLFMVRPWEIEDLIREGADLADSAMTKTIRVRGLP